MPPKRGRKQSPQKVVVDKKEEEELLAEEEDEVVEVPEDKPSEIESQDEKIEASEKEEAEEEEVKELELEVDPEEEFADEATNEKAANQTAEEEPMETEVDDQKPTVVLTNMKAEVIKSRRFGIYLSFTHEGKTHQACLEPGRSFVNSTHLLLDQCKTDPELNRLFPKGLKVNIDVKERTFIKNDTGGSKGFDSKVSWLVTLLWIGETKPTEQEIHAGGNDAAKESFWKRMGSVEAHIFDEEYKPFATTEEDWFVTGMVYSKQGLPHPNDAKVKATGVVESLLLPHGGLVKVNDELVFFHRARIFFDTELISSTDTLSKVLPVGTEVNVWYSKGEDLPGNPFKDIRKSDNVALITYTGEEPEIPQTVFLKPEETKKSVYIARILEFTDIGATGAEGGVAKLINQPPQNHFKNVVAKPTISKVRFKRENLVHMGACLVNADLQYFFTPGVYAMDIFFCHVEPIADAKESDEIKHEVTLGWKDNISLNHSIGAGSPYAAAKPEDSLLYPKIHGFYFSKLFGRELWDVKTYEKILSGSAKPKHEYYGELTDTKDLVKGRVSDLFPPPHGKSEVQSGLIHVETGEHAGSQCFFERENMSVFGLNLAKADMQLMLQQNDPVYLRVIDKSNTKVFKTKLTASEVFIGWSQDKDKPEPDMTNCIKSRRHELLLYLERHVMNLEKLKLFSQGKGPVRNYIPFRKEENKGTVVQLMRSKKKSSSYAYGGVIKVHNGKYQGQYVSFNRKSCWVLGYNLSHADLTHIFIEGQKVSLEATPKVSPETIGDHEVSLHATMVWTSKFIPRNDMQKTVPESNHVNSWLKKRGLKWDDFQKLVQGKLPDVPADMATKQKSNMLKGNDITMLNIMNSAITEKKGNVQTAQSMPHFKHGMDTSKLLDQALSVNGPNDKRITGLISNDKMAQVAFNLYKTLETAVEGYRRSKGISSRPKAAAPWASNRPVVPEQIWDSSATGQMPMEAPVAYNRQTGGNVAFNNGQPHGTNTSYNGKGYYGNGGGYQRPRQNQGVKRSHSHQRSDRNKMPPQNSDEAPMKKAKTQNQKKPGENNQNKNDKTPNKRRGTRRGKRARKAN